MNGERPVTVVPKAAEIIAARFRRAIADGALEPGTQLPAQPDLAEEHGVSAPTMREALRILETEGLMTVRRGVHGGAYVNAPGLSAVARQLGMYLQLQGATARDLWEARMIFEPQAARLLADHWSKPAAKDLEGCLEEERQSLEDPAKVIRAGSRFHVRLLQHSGNVTLAAIGTVIADIVERHLEATVSGAPDISVVTKAGLRRQEHLVKLMAVGDGAGAERHWRKTLGEALALVESGGRADEPLDLVR